MHIHINNDNKNEVDNLYIHDSFFTGYQYNYTERQITLTCNNDYLKKTFFFKFNNVIFSKLESFALWGKGANIMYISLEEDARKLDELTQKYSTTPDYKLSYLGQETPYLIINFLINSGDELFIICENIDYVEMAYKI